MTIKDWKQYGYWSDYYPSDEYIKVNDRRSYIKIWKTGLPLKEMKRRGEQGIFLVEIKNNMKNKLIKKSFKTKSEAIKFAKEYMKKN